MLFQHEGIDSFVFIAIIFPTKTFLILIRGN